jgi:hypothetical protein
MERRLNASIFLWCAWNRQFCAVCELTSKPRVTNCISRVSNERTNERSMLLDRCGRLDVLVEPHCRRQPMTGSCLYISSKAYGSNTTHCLRDRGLRWVSATQEISAFWWMHRSINEIYFFPPYLMAPSFHPTEIGYDIVCKMYRHHNFLFWCLF